MERKYLRYKDMSPNQLNSEFLTIFEMLPKDYSSDRVNPRQRSELRELSGNKLKSIFEQTPLSDSCAEFFCEKHAEYSVSGLNESNPEREAFIGLIRYIKLSENGIFDPEVAKRVEMGAFEMEIERIASLDRQLQMTIGVDAELLEGDIYRKNDRLDSWSFDFREIYGEEIFLPISQ